MTKIKSKKTSVISAWSKDDRPREKLLKWVTSDAVHNPAPVKDVRYKNGYSMERNSYLCHKSIVRGKIYTASGVKHKM